LTGTSGFLGKELKGYGLDSGEMWRHSMAVAFGAKKIAILKREQFSDDAFTAGLIHDVGKLILNAHILDRKTVFDKYIKNNDQKLLNAERKLLGLDHAKIAAKVCEKWNFPETIYTAIGYHHDPDKFKTNELACIINVADEIAKWYEKDKEMMLIDINKTARKVLDINPDKMRQTLSEVTRYVDQIVEQMSGV
jgi:putative nucleotidyltransferase with HDIG domain